MKANECEKPFSAFTRNFDIPFEGAWQSLQTKTECDRELVHES